MISLQTAITSILVLSLIFPAQCANLFASGISNQQLQRASCANTVKTLNRNPALDKLFQISDLYFTDFETVCQNKDLVISNCKKLVQSCIFPAIQSDAIMNRNSVYLVFSNTNAVNAACSRASRPRLGTCQQEVISGAYTTDISRQDLCTPCQKRFWNSFGRKAGYAPALYYTQILFQTDYLAKLNKVCGRNFFN